MTQVHASVETNAAPAPTANGSAVPGSRPRWLSRRVFKPVAPAITGSATYLDSRFASGRGEAPQPPRAQRRAVTRDPGNQRAGLGHTEPQRVGGAGLLVSA